MTDCSCIYMLGPGKLIINSDTKAHRERFVRLVLKSISAI